MGRLIINTDENGVKTAADPCLAPCPIERGMRIIGGKWTGSIPWHLQDGPVRFNDLARQMQAASKKVINDRLKQMEQNRLIKRTVLQDKPVAVTYELTEFGRTALSFLEDIKDWTIEHDL